jgi:zinc transporter
MDNPDANYGSDRNGLVWGYILGDGQEAIPIDSDGAASWLATASPAEPGRFLWLHFSLANAACRSWLRNHLDLPDAFHDALREGSGSTRVEREGDALLAVIHDVLFDFTFDPSDVSTVTLCVQPRLIISARLKPLRSLDRVRSSVKAGDGFTSSAGLLAQLLRDQAGVLADILRQATRRVDEIEDAVLTNRVSASRTELGSLRRLLVRLQRLLAPEPAALFRLLSRPPAWVAVEDVQDLRESAEEFSVAVADSAALGERVKLLQEELAATVNERTGRTLFVLTVVTVLALPINLLAGLFGMNVGGIPFAENPTGFWTVLGTLVTFTVIVGYLALRRFRD